MSKVSISHVSSLTLLACAGIKVMMRYNTYNVRLSNPFRSNFLGTSFTVFDGGLSPHKGKTMPDGSNVRQELAAVHYVSKV